MPAHRVACHAVTDDGRLQAPAELPLLAHARWSPLRQPPAPRCPTMDPTPSPARRAGQSRRMIELRGLRVHFPLRRSISAWLRREPPGLVRAVDGVDLDLGQGRDRGARGRVGVGQDDHRPRPRAAGAHHRWPGAPRGQGRDRASGAARCATTGAASRSSSRTPTRAWTRGGPSATRWPSRSRCRPSARAQERAARVDEALEDAGLRPPSRYRDRFPHELSGGQRQRVAIACAMMLGPDVLVADEPVSMLDVSLRSGILRVMLGPARAARRRHPVHHPRPVARLAHRRPDRGHVPRPDRGDRPRRAAGA